jgi:GrpB-like predicted nucleotidyltransferase (UPF0157 family)
MKIEPFDEGLDHRRILPYDPAYRVIFLLLKDYVRSKLPRVELIHIGSTAIPDLRGKPMLDVVAITNRRDLRAEQRAFEGLGFHRRDVWVDRDDKPYVCGSLCHSGRTYNVNIHVCHRNAPVHTSSLAFLKLLRERPDLRRRYEQAKDQAHSVEPANPERYNREKEFFFNEIRELLD